MSQYLGEPLPKRMWQGQIVLLKTIKRTRR